MSEVSEESLRASLDEDGILRPGTLDSPRREGAFTVFAQRPDARLELATLQRHAEQFFDARVGLTVDKRYPRAFPEVDAARLVIAPRAGIEGVRFCYGRARTEDDLRIAEIADARAGSPGLGLLARRCATVWLIVVDREGERDAVALLGAAILASVVLGPILAPDQEALFGVRTARARLEQVTGPYR